MASAVMKPALHLPDRSTFRWFFGIALTLLLCRWAYDGLSIQQIMFLLKPTAWSITLSTGAHGQVLPDGIAFHSLGVLLDRSCAGGHFALVLAAFLVFLLRATATTTIRTAVLVLGAVAIALPITILGNVWRVLLTLAIARMDPTHHYGGTVTMHLVIGSFVQLALLLIAHGIIRYTFTHRTRLA